MKKYIEDSFELTSGDSLEQLLANAKQTTNSNFGKLTIPK